MTIPGKWKRGAARAKRRPLRPLHARSWRLGEANHPLLVPPGQIRPARALRRRYGSTTVSHDPEGDNYLKVVVCLSGTISPLPHATVKASNRVTRACARSLRAVRARGAARRSPTVVHCAPVARTRKRHAAASGTRSRTCWKANGARSARAATHLVRGHRAATIQRDDPQQQAVVARAGGASIMCRGHRRTPDMLKQVCGCDSQCR